MASSQGSLLRTRWAAIGAAVAVTLGGGGIAFVDAAKDSGDRPVAVFLDEPCRIRDTRPDKGVGGRTAPLGPTEAYTVQGTGPSGNCDVPADAVGLVTNVTADQATQNTNLRLYPTGGTIPTTANLNPRPGAPPTPNAVTVGLNRSGQFDIRNAQGTVHVVIDVIAYFVGHTHDDRYYTEAETDAKVAASPPPWGVIPSGLTVTGAFFDRTYIETAGQQIRYMVQLPAHTPLPLTTATTGFGPTSLPAIPASEQDATCTGSYFAPTAPAGQLCLYPSDATGFAASSASVVPLQPFPTQGVVLRGTSLGNSDTEWDLSWAYTAP